MGIINNCTMNQDQNANITLIINTFNMKKIILFNRLLTVSDGWKTTYVLLALLWCAYLTSYKRSV